MELILSFAAFAMIALLAAASPGPDFLVVSKNSLAHSRRAGVWTAIGVGAALLVHVTYTLVGIGLIISQSVLLFSVIKMLGAIYIVWLGFSILISKGLYEIPLPEEQVTYKAPLSALREGFLTIFFVSIFTQFVSPELPKVIQAAYGIEVALIVMSWFIMLSFVLTMSLVQKKLGVVQAKLMKVMGVALIALGVKVALSDR